MEEAARASWRAAFWRADDPATAHSDSIGNICNGAGLEPALRQLAQVIAAAIRPR